VWYRLSTNINAINLLKNNLDKINWGLLTINPNAGELLKNNRDKLNWEWISENPAIFKLDYDAIKNRLISVIEEDLMKVCFHPNRLERYLYEYNYDIGTDDDYE
jgi:hypothetical protein